MTEEEAFVQAICENPDDDTPRLAFVDWLSELGCERRANFIRGQLSENGLLTYRDFSSQPEIMFDGSYSTEPLPWFNLSRFRDMLSLQIWDHVEKPVATVRTRNTSWDGVTWRRGFVDHVQCSFHAWLNISQGRHPIRSASIRGPQVEVYDLTSHRCSDWKPLPANHVRLAVANRTNRRYLDYTAVLPKGFFEELCRVTLRPLLTEILKQNFPTVQFTILRDR